MWGELLNITELLWITTSAAASVAAAMWNRVTGIASVATLN